MAVRLERGNEESLVETHEINVTPFIDVILVLLIIFMVAAPLATVDVPVDLPPSTAAQQPRPEKPAYVTLLSDLSLRLGEDAVSRAGLGLALDAITGGDREQRVFLRGDRNVEYGAVMEVMNTLRQAGYGRIALVGIESAPGTISVPEIQGARSVACGFHEHMDGRPRGDRPLSL